ncbi:cytochrome b/b6 domain-containing protein [Microbacterium sp. Kw_RZR3]|uniref:cytochrome b/b6 domain-containing protein n=1 Tax=Microbacterium sp. Kw_RZR3 TaxID=3032903 RepID=UPI0023DCDCA4|nr:cytochrome b/b6 domain-containing protein [Microbacterium sp. Kw_RZR3]MDF2048167.1 cytochrome b/b6 domain-containing protein [Microbacterium sp. Kw_RZR3]
MASTPRNPRRGLPRVPGGEPWPPAVSGAPEAGDDISVVGAAPVQGARGDGEPWPPGSVVADSENGGGSGRSGEIDPNPVTLSESAAVSVAQDAAGLADSASSGREPLSDPDAADSAPTSEVRRGLPRVSGGEPWPPASARADSENGGRSGRIGEIDPNPVTLSESATPSAAPRPPLAVRRTVWPGVAASAPRPAKAEPHRIGPYTPLQWLGSMIVLGVFAFALAGIAVLLARFVLALEPGRDFLAAFPGEYPLPEGAPVGLPVWLNWSHFLNSFFLLFIIRTGWQVRREKRPSAFWSPRKNKKRRISLTLWFHQAVDILWIANGVVFVVLLFATGQWMRIVPTSWEVFPNALSAALQYVSLDWPTENGWVNYNSLQQLSYFAITFVAAPLAIVSGVRLSGVWPKNAEKLNRMYPLEWARRIHFPVMLFFVAFIVVHVGLVLATGALRNLNHMYAARGAVDPDAFTSDPTGLLIFAASLLMMAAGWVAARPRVLAPIARLFGDVKMR